jgi:hypothetical protein
MTGPCENLANAIVMQAVKDYRQAQHKLRKRPKNAEAKAMIEDCEGFFLSEWFETLTNVDGKMILKKLKQEDDR